MFQEVYKGEKQWSQIYFEKNLPQEMCMSTRWRLNKEKEDFSPNIMQEGWLIESNRLPNPRS